MITLDLSILNQKGTPLFYSDTLALRPAFGIVGRIFIATDSPYGIYRDTGSAWDQIAGSGGGGGIGGSGTLNTIALFTPDGSNIGNSVITQSGTAVTIAQRNTVITNGNITLSHVHPALNGTVNPYGEQIAVTNTFNAAISWTALLACFNSSSLQTNNWNGSASFGNGSYTTNFLNLSNITFNNAGAVITSTQASGGIRAWANQILQLRIDGTNNGIYSHYANSVIYGDFASSTARLNIQNRYGYLVNNLDEYSAGHTYTNRWAFYNAGISDNNFFAGKVGIGSGYVPSSFQFDVIGNARFSGQITATGGITSTLYEFPSGNNVTGTSVMQWVNSGGIKAVKLLNVNTSTAVGFAYNGSTGPAYMFGRTGFEIFFGIGLDESNMNATNATFYIAGTNKLIINKQTSINDASPSASAIFNITSTTQGFKPPSMTTAQKNAIGTPVTGLIVFDTTLIKLCVYNGVSWETVTSI